jgi:hypothetical protein
VTNTVSRLRLGIGVLAVPALAACVYLAFRSPREIASAYLSAYLFFLAPAMGSLVLLALHFITGGRWGLALQTPLVVALRVLPVLALLFIPLLVCATDLYPWAATRDAVRSWYLNIPFFVARAVVCFAVWLWLARSVRIRLEGRPGDFALFAAVALIAYLVTTTTATTDWIMSLALPWHSAVFGLTVGLSQVLCAAALGALTFRRQGTDLSRLLLTLVLVWAYLLFMDYLTAWMADLPDETVWYLPRTLGGWRWLGLGVVVLGLVAPFCILLSPQSNTSRLLLRITGATASGWCFPV